MPANTPRWSHLGINEIQGWHIWEYFKEGGDHFLLSNGADAFYKFNIIWHQQYRFIVYRCEDLNSCTA